jgi:ABC-type glycerol-3-phosphate transport system substrate-binding protein
MWDIESMRAAREQGLNWAADLPPKTPDGGLSFYMHLECWAIAKATKVPKAAWQYVRDFTTNETANFIKYYPGIPMMKKDFNMFVTEEGKAFGWERVADIIADPKNIRIPGAGAKFDKISGLVQAELDLVFTGEKTAQQAAEAACPLVDEELARTS